MLTFFEFLLLLESAAHERVHHNISVSHLKALTKTHPEGKMRYSIDHAGKLHAGDATKFIHADLHGYTHGGDGNPNKSIRGYIEHKDGVYRHHIAYKFGFHSDSPIDNHTLTTKHPVIDKMHAAGIRQTHNAFSWEG